MSKKCNKIKDIFDFHKNRSQKDGIGTQCKLCANESRTLLYFSKIDIERENRREYYKKNKKNLNAKSSEQYVVNRTKIIDAAARYRKENKDSINQYFRKRRSEDLNFRISCNLRVRLSEAVRGNPKSQKTLCLLGCTVESFKRHLECLFQPGMTWENYGKWHIDHKIPLSSAKTVKEIEKLCHFNNLQPLWAKDNVSKGAKLNWKSNLY